MEISSGIKASLAGRYAAALYELAAEQAAVATVEADFDALASALGESPEFAELTRNPELSRDNAAGALAAVADVLGLSPLTRNFLGVICQNRRLAKLGAIAAAFKAIAIAQRGEVTAQVTSAFPLDEGQLTEIGSALSTRAGAQVKITTHVEPAILGGLVVRIGSQLIDSSIQTRLHSLAQAMQG